MYYIQLLVEILLLSIFSVFLMKFFSRFKLKKFYVVFFCMPLFSFAFGYSLRLTEDKFLVDNGFFVTDFSFLFVYLLTAIALILGQLKYWKIQ